MKTIRLKLLSYGKHNSQILTGFQMLNKNHPNEYSLIISDERKANSPGKYDIPLIAEVEYNGKKIIYDTADGYFEGIERWCEDCDVYFKRSFSPQKTNALSADIAKKIYPLGFNYSVFYPGNIYADSSNLLKRSIKTILGRKEEAYFTPEKFECAPTYNGRKPKIIFFTRLWSPESFLSKEKNEERCYINETRIEIIKKLKETYKTNFLGGIYSDAFSESYCQELILPSHLTRREKYLKIMHGFDITIGSMGLHESIGWKTAEYIAASKAIINERFHYYVPGNFKEGVNYLPFDTADDCINNVKILIL